MRRIIRVLLLTLLIVSVGVTIAREYGASAKTAEPCPPSDCKMPAAASPRVIAYYFHGTQRCSTCKKLEAYTREAIETSFPEALKTGELQILSINVDEPENNHFVDDFKLDFRAVVLVEQRDGKQLRWKTLKKIWDLVGEKPGFLSYIQSETGAFLKGA